MKETRLALPYIGAIAGTRMALGVGVGLLVAKKLTASARRNAGWALVALGAITTIPLVIKIVAGTEPEYSI